MTACLVDDCDRPHYGRGYCVMHYHRQRRAGVLKRRTPEERFWSKVDKTQTCWNWTGSRNQGYGTFRSSTGQVVKAHRQSWEWTRGPIPDGLELDHLCRNRSCVNPDHLEPVTKRENWERGHSPSALAYGQPTCQRGHTNRYLDSSGHKMVCRECRKISVQKYKGKLKAIRQQQIE